jgi:hypothetical protein
MAEPYVRNGIVEGADTGNEVALKQQSSWREQRLLQEDTVVNTNGGISGNSSNRGGLTEEKVQNKEEMLQEFARLT